MKLERRFLLEELDACFVVRDHNGHKLAYVYFEAEPGQRCLRHFRDLMRSPCSRKSALAMGREHKSIQVGVNGHRASNHNIADVR
jgi:hypothetical protein